MFLVAGLASVCLSQFALTGCRALCQGSTRCVSDRQSCTDVWPHEPPGFVVVTDYGFSDPIPRTSGDESLPVGCGWGVVFNGYGLAALGQADGVMQYWFNGTLVIDRHDILFRTGARPTIQFHQFLIGPYIGDGSPVDQSMWVDNLTVATAKP